MLTVWEMFQAWCKNNPEWELSYLRLFDDGSGRLVRCRLNETDGEMVATWNSLEQAIVRLGELIGDA